MSAFRQHFLEKYFGYRRLYVAYVLREAPERASLAVLSEIARLSFMIAGNLLCATILWVLAFDAAAREGVVAVWPPVFALCALMPTLFVILAVGGLAAALRARRHVAAEAGAAAARDGRRNCLASAPR